MIKERPKLSLTAIEPPAGIKPWQFGIGETIYIASMFHGYDVAHEIIGAAFTPSGFPHYHLRNPDGATHWAPQLRLARSPVPHKSRNEGT